MSESNQEPVTSVDDSGAAIMEAKSDNSSMFRSVRLVTADAYFPPEGNNDETFGRKKAPPTSDPSLKKDATNFEEIAKYTFTLGAPINIAVVEEESAPVAIHVSSGSSTSSTENTGECFATTMVDKQRRINKSLLLRTVSRQGRESQRWLTEADTQQRVRLVTGCVPILTGGRILFVSASRKPEWILPKGGWEQDETMQESAIREAYEEAGVLGTLGPPLAPFLYETRKSKKRRMEMNELMRKSTTFDDTADEEAKDPLPNMPAPSIGTVHQDPTEAPIKGAHNSISILSDDVVNRIRESQPKTRSDETSSNASDSSSYLFVKLTMFPMYVSEIRDSWPECGRYRKVVHIDQAIEMLESRAELRSALIQIKERNLHILSQTPATVVQND